MASNQKEARQEKNEKVKILSPSEILLDDEDDEDGGSRSRKASRNVWLSNNTMKHLSLGSQH